MSYYLMVKNVLYTLLLVYNIYYLYLAVKTKGPNKIIRIIISLLFILLSVTELIDHNLMKHKYQENTSYQQNENLEKNTNDNSNQKEVSDEAEEYQEKSNNDQYENQQEPKEVRNEAPWENDPNSANYSLGN